MSISFCTTGKGYRIFGVDAVHFAVVAVGISADGAECSEGEEDEGGLHRKSSTGSQSFSKQTRVVALGGMCLWVGDNALVWVASEDGGEDPREHPGQEAS